jgi:hypothetical protein
MISNGSAGEYHLNNNNDGDDNNNTNNSTCNSNNEEKQPQHITNNNREKNRWLFRRCFHCNSSSSSSSNKRLVDAVSVAVGLILLISAFRVVVVLDHPRLADNNNNIHEWWCPRDHVERWVYYQDAYFKYSLYVGTSNPLPILILHNGMGVYYYYSVKADDDAIDNDDSVQRYSFFNPNDFRNRHGCTSDVDGGDWSVVYGNLDADGGGGTSPSFAYESFSIPYKNDDEYSSYGQQQTTGGTLFMGGVVYDLKNNGSVFLVAFDEQNAGSYTVTQLSGLDVSSLMIDQQKTWSVKSVTKFCYANQEILDFFDSALANSNNNNNGDDDA